MRKTYRAHEGNKAYWQSRWDNVDADTGELNLNSYPGKQAAAAINGLRPDGAILEAGCGVGRLLKYFIKTSSIIGLDFIPSALKKITDTETSIPLLAGDITKLPFKDEQFSAVLAFGLYHNLENGIEKALSETNRILKPGGIVCASIRADNFQNRIIDHLAKKRVSTQTPKSFHKANYSTQEVQSLFTQAGFSIQKVEYIDNMPFLYKFKFFRHRTHVVFNEQLARAEGYKLSSFGALLQSIMKNLFKAEFCNIIVVTAVRS